MDQGILFEPTAIEAVRSMSMEQREVRAIDLLRANEPADGYYLGFSGGKDSIVIKELAKRSGVKFDAHYNNTTIDPPELVRFIKEHHSDVMWSNPKIPMMRMVADSYKTPPTRRGRWCCEVYKERGGEGRVKIFGVRAQESKSRAKNWFEVAADRNADKAICPVVCWTTEQIWEYIHGHNIPYCSLYDEGFERLGCVGCMLATKENQEREFERWPNFKRNWKNAIIANWEKWHAVPRQKDGKPRYHAKFESGEEFWEWWCNYRAPARDRECQPDIMWTNSDLEKPEISRNIDHPPDCITTPDERSELIQIAINGKSLNIDPS